MEDSNTPEQPPRDEEAENPILKKHLSKKKFLILFGYTVLLITVFSCLFFRRLECTKFLSKSEADDLLVVFLNTKPSVDEAKGKEKAQPEKAKPEVVTTKPGFKDTLIKPKPDSIKKERPVDIDQTNAVQTRVGKGDYNQDIKQIMLNILKLMLISGVLGGCLGNLRGFYYHYLYFGFFPKVKEIPYYVRPIIGALTGLFVFFISSFLNSTTSYDSQIPKWITITGAIPSLAFAFLAGFACLELMSRLKQIAESLFGYKATEPANSKEIDAKGKLLENLNSARKHKLKNAPLSLTRTVQGIGLRTACDNPLESLTDVYLLDNPDEEIVLTVSEIVGQTASSKISLGATVVSPSEKDEFSLSLGIASELAGETLRITTLIINSHEDAETVGMQVTLNNEDYTYLCTKPEAGQFTFHTNIKFFNRSEL